MTIQEFIQQYMPDYDKRITDIALRVEKILNSNMASRQKIVHFSGCIISYRLEDIREELELQMLRTNAKELNDKIGSKIESMPKDKLTPLIEFYKTLCIE